MILSRTLILIMFSRSVVQVSLSLDILAHTLSLPLSLSRLLSLPAYPPFYLFHSISKDGYPFESSFGSSGHIFFFGAHRARHTLVNRPFVVGRV